MQWLNVKVNGLYTYPNPLSEVPQGALVQADNIVIDSASVAKSRRGFSRLSNNLPSASDRVHSFSGYQDKLLAHFGTSKLGYYDAGWQVYSGSYESPDANTARMKFEQSNSNLYFTSDTGVKRLDAFDGTPVSAGIPKALDVTASLTGASGFLSDTSQVAYRVVWGRRDANNNLHLGAPSQREIIVNTSGGTRDVALAITIPEGITTEDFFQVYRSAEFDSAVTEPNDELGLIYEANPTSGEISAGSISFTDNTPASLRGATLYTSPSQQGIGQANEQPPFAHDLARFKGMMFYANIYSKQRKIVTLLAVGGTNGIAAADTITIAGVTYTADGSSEDASTGQFLVSTGGTSAQNIADTARSLVRVVNQHSSSTVYAYYLSGENELPGKILLEDRELGGVSWAITASAHGSAWNPALPTSGTSVSSENERYQHAIAVSKEEQPEAVPLTNRLFCGSASDPIYRILPLRDSLFALKPKDGIFRITGTNPSTLSRDLFDSTTRIIAPETAVVFNDQIWALTDQGVVTISDVGVEVKSLPIEDTLLELFGTGLTTVRNLAFAVGYETDRKYILWMPSNAADVFPTQAFVYSTVTDEWTRWDLDKVAGFVNPSNGKLYLGDALGNYVNEERKSFDYTDYVDEELSVTISSFDGKEIVLSDASEVEVGDLLYQSSSVRSVVTAVDSTTNTVTVHNSLSTWQVGAASLFKAIDCVVKWVPITSNNPGILKHFSEALILLGFNRFNTATLSFSSDLSVSESEVPIQGHGTAGFGLFPWGQSGWGNARPSKPIRTYIPSTKARCSQLNITFQHRVGYSNFELQGISLRYREGKPTVTR